jgi:Ca2+-binding RTX toxin-like protein
MAVIYRNAHLAGTDVQQPDSTPSGWQKNLTFVPLADGGFIAIWSDQSQTASGQLWGRRYDSGGRPVDGEFAIHGPGPGYRDSPSAAPLAGGGFVVTWTIEDSDLDSVDLVAQIFDSNGKKVGGELPVNTGTEGYQGESITVGLEGGGFVVLWRDIAGFGQDVFRAQVFDPAGARVGDEIVVDPDLMGDLSADVAPLAGGGFVIVSDGVGTEPHDLSAQIYDSEGDPIGASIAVNTTTDGNQRWPTVAGLPSGGFVVAWSDDSQVSDSSHVFQIRVQRFDAGGSKLGAEIAATPFVPYSANGQYSPSIAAGVDGSFAVSWMEHVPGSGAEIRAQLFDASGGRIGDPVPVNLVAQGDQYLPEVAMLPGGALVVGWRQGQPGGLDDVQLRVFFPAQLGTAEDDFMGGSDGRDFMDGLDGNDELSGGLEEDALFGGAGNDGVQGGDGDDELHGDDGDDQLDGDLGNDVLDGGPGVDIMRGGPGNDVLYFGSALSAGDVADGGAGRDAIVLHGNVTVALNDANLVGIESISIQSGANTRFGDTANNFYDFNITTADGNVLAGQQLIVNASSLRAGEDFTFDGSAETDGKFLIYGGHGVDNLTGGDGVDVFFFEGSRWGASDRVDGGAGRDALTISGGSGLTRIEFGAMSFTNIESISLNNRYATDPSQKPSYELILHNGNLAPGTTLIANGSSVPLGQVVNIDGRGVHDGNLTLLGGGGHDVMFGGSGADVMIGGTGADALTGGAGADTFRYDSALDSVEGREDLIGDFQSGSDRFDLSRVDANSNSAGDQAFTWIGSNAFSGVAGELRTFEQGGYRWIAGDTDGDGDGDLVIALQPGAPLVQGDFLP